MKTEKEITDISERIAQITKNSDPFEKEIESVKQKRDKVSPQLLTAQNELESLEIYECPDIKDQELWSNILTAFKYGAVVYVGGVIVLFAFHILYWFVRWIWSDPWQTWEWVKFFFKYGCWAGATVFALASIISIVKAATFQKRLARFIEYDENKNQCLKKIEDIKTKLAQIDKEEKDYVESRYSVVEKALRDIAVPVPVGLVTGKNYDNIKKSYLKFKALSAKESSATGDEKKTIRRELADAKLRFVYEVSMKAEAGTKDAYAEFGKCYQKALSTNNLSPLRHDLPSSGKFQTTDKISSIQSALRRDNMKNLLSEFEKSRNKDTNSFIIFTNTRKLAGQTEEMMNIVRKASDEYGRVQDASETITSILNYSRMCAYRNLYLGVELLNFVRNGAGGGKLTTAKSSFVVEGVGIANGGSFNATDFKADIGVTLNSALGFMETVSNSRILTKFAERNPAIALGATAFVAVSDFINERNAKIDQNLGIQKELVENMDLMAEGYTQGRAQILRSAEIVKAIIKANNGFMSIYEPLGKRVFEEDNPMVSVEELRELSRAIQAYKEISMTEL